MKTRKGRVVKCDACSKEFYASPFRLKTKTLTCSRKCSATFSRAKPDQPCAVCKIVFHIKASAKSKAKQDPTCSRVCRAEYLKLAYAGNANPNFRYNDKLDKFFAMKICNVSRSADKRGLSCTITAVDLRRQYDMQNGLCYYTGMPMAQRSVKWSAKNQADPDVLSVDRVDSSRGYEQGNIVLCCVGINKLKGASDIAEVGDFLSGVAIKHLGTCRICVKKLNPTAALPVRSKLGDGGFDLTVSTVEDLGDLVKVGFGIAVQPSPGWVTLILPRSSNYKKHIVLTNSLGLVDHGYTGEISAVFIKTPGYVGLTVGDRVAQLMPVKLPRVDVVEVDELVQTERGTGGYGSSGK